MSTSAKVSYTQNIVFFNYGDFFCCSNPFQYNKLYMDFIALICVLVYVMLLLNEWGECTANWEGLGANFGGPVSAAPSPFRWTQPTSGILILIATYCLETGAVLAYSDPVCTFIFFFLYACTLIVQLFALSTLFNGPNLALGTPSCLQSEIINNWLLFKKKLKVL